MTESLDSMHLKRSSPEIGLSIALTNLITSFAALASNSAISSQSKQHQHILLISWRYLVNRVRRGPDQSIPAN